MDQKLHILRKLCFLKIITCYFFSFAEHSMDWKKYHRLNDIYDYLYYLQQHYPQLVEVIDIGKSVEKRPMLVLKIGSKKFSDKPAIVIEGGKMANIFHIKIRC